MLYLIPTFYYVATRLQSNAERRAFCVHHLRTTSSSSSVSWLPSRCSTWRCFIKLCLTQPTPPPSQRRWSPSAGSFHIKGFNVNVKKNVWNVGLMLKTSVRSDSASFKQQQTFVKSKVCVQLRQSCEFSLDSGSSTCWNILFDVYQKTEMNIFTLTFIRLM